MGSDSPSTARVAEEDCQSSNRGQPDGGREVAIWYIPDMTRVYEEIVDFIAAGATSEAVAAFRPSDEVRARVADLIEREKVGTLSAEEGSELDHFMQLEHVMRLAKARARQHAAHE